MQVCREALFPSILGKSFPQQYVRKQLLFSKIGIVTEPGLQLLWTHSPMLRLLGCHDTAEFKLLPIGQNKVTTKCIFNQHLIHCCLSGTFKCSSAEIILQKLYKSKANFRAKITEFEKGRLFKMKRFSDCTCSIRMRSLSKRSSSILSLSSFCLSISRRSLSLCKRSRSSRSRITLMRSCSRRSLSAISLRLTKISIQKYLNYASTV